MKKIILSLMLLFVLASCDKVTIEKHAEETPVYVTVFSYQNHTFIEFVEGKHSGFTHSPECECTKLHLTGME